MQTALAWKPRESTELPSSAVWKSGFFYDFLKDWCKLTQGNEEKWKIQTATASVASTGID